MNIGILVYSQTGNTLSVAERLAEHLTAGGQAAAIERVTIQGEPKPGTPAVLLNAPDPAGYDALVFASPVQGFSLAQAMKDYLAQVDGFSGKPVAVFSTQYLRQAWLGGNKAIRQMTALCEAKGGHVCGSGLVGWSRKDRETQIAELLDRLSGAICPA